MRRLNDLSGVLRSAYALSHMGEYGRARELIKEAIDALVRTPDPHDVVDLDILETCLDWIEAGAEAFYGDRPVLPYRTRLQA